MPALQFFNVKHKGKSDKEPQATTIDILAHQLFSQEVLEQATRVRERCEHPIIINKFSVQPYGVDLAFAQLEEGGPYIHEIKVHYQFLGKNHHTTFDYIDFERMPNNIPIK